MVHSNEQRTFVNIVVNNRKHIAKVIRDLRMHYGFPRIERLDAPAPQMEISKSAKICSALLKSNF